MSLANVVRKLIKEGKETAPGLPGAEKEEEDGRFVKVPASSLVGAYVAKYEEGETGSFLVLRKDGKYWWVNCEGTAEEYSPKEELIDPDPEQRPMR